MIRPVPRSKHALAAAVVAASAALGAAGASALPALVTNGNDMGEGSLRAALESGATEIVVSTDQDIMIMSPLVYTGERKLQLYGTGQTVMTMENHTLLEVASGANLEVIGLNFMGPGGYDINNPASEPAGKGIFVDVADDQSGTVKVVLKDVTVSGVANHGVHISDCDLADDCGGGGGGAGGGSAASIVVEFTNVTIDNVGYGKFDADGLRVDERDAGNIIFRASGSTFTNVGADGVELDEGQDGVIVATVNDSSFNDNGGYCDPDQLGDELAAFLGSYEEEGEFEGEVPGDFPGAPTAEAFTDPRCIELVFEEDDGVTEYEYAIDVDDGFDIDEAGNGSLIADIINSEVLRNLDEGIDFDEEDNGAIDANYINVMASENSDDGFKMSEEGPAGVRSLLLGSTAIDNGGKGAVWEEEDFGDVNVLVIGATTSGNDDGEEDLEAVQEDEGSGTITVQDSDIAGEIVADGVELIQ
jgi:hypothetical protein